MKAELSQAKLQSKNRQRIPRAAWLLQMSGCLQIIQESNDSLKGLGKTGHYDNHKIKCCQLPH